MDGYTKKQVVLLHRGIKIFEMINKGIDIRRIYLDEGVRDNIRINMLQFGYRTFLTAKIINKFDVYEQFVESNNRQLKQTFDNEVKSFVTEFAFDSLIDSIKICICFENYFKEMLLNSGYIIHEATLKEIKNRQKKQPIKLNDLTSKNIIDLDTLKPVISEHTLKFSYLIEKQEYFIHYNNISENHLNLLRMLNERRNTLHLFSSENITVSNSILNAYKELRRIVLCDMAIKVNMIIDKYPNAKMGRLPINCSK